MNFLKRGKKRSRKAFVIGLDCAAPELVFERWRDRLPNLDRLMRGGWHGPLRSTIPAITVPAWSSMLTSKDPGTLGFYGFRNRADTSYEKMAIAMGDRVREKRVWNLLGERGLESIVLGVPQTYPVRPLKGHLVSGFLTPNQKSDFSYPFRFREEVLAKVPEYAFDVKEFRTENKAYLLQQIHDMTDSHFQLVDYALRSKPWDFFMTVEIGLDRMHHAFWHYQDESHFRYEPDSEFRSAVFDYYKKVDDKIGEWLSLLDDRTLVMIVSDHGAKRMDGGICVNEWLWRHGYLAFKKDPVPGTIVRFEDMEVDWSRTRAWGSGGYYGRVFLNVKGREPEGVVAQQDYESTRDSLAEALSAITDPRGNPLGTRVFKPQDIYREVKNIPPDLIVYFGDLFWRSVGSLGYDGWHTFENDTGPDSCNHAEDGLFILYEPGRVDAGRRIEGAHLMDVAPTLLESMGVPVPSDMQGRPYFH